MKHFSTTLKLLFLTFLLIGSLAFTVYAVDTTPETELETELSTEKETETEIETETETQKDTEELPDIKIGRVTGLLSSIKGTTLTLTWNPVILADYYNIWEINGTKKTKIATNVKATKYVIPNLQTEKGYTYTVTAVSNKKGEGDPAVPETVIITNKKPPVPAQFNIKSTYKRSLTLTWNAVAGIKGYEIFTYDDSAGKFIPLASVKKSLTTHTFTKLQYSSPYRFHIRSYILAADGTRIYSAPSKEINVTLQEFSSKVNNVRAPRYKVKAIRTTVGTEKKTGKKITIKKDSKFTATSKYGTKVTCYLASGKVATVKRSDLSYYGLDGTTNGDYSTQVKEDYVNLRHITSRTKYLIWISEYRYKVNIFKKVSGKWALQKSYPCIVGTYKTRTVGTGRLLKKVLHGKYGTPMLWFHKYKGTISNPNGCAFHQYIDSNRRGSLSHGCVRLPNEALYWMYNNIPINTRVLIL